MAAGPFAEREKFDPKAAAKKAIDAARSDNGQAEKSDGRKRLSSGKPTSQGQAADPSSAKAPWELDGRKWHTRDRVARNGNPARWDGGFSTSSSTSSKRKEATPFHRPNGPMRGRPDLPGRSREADWFSVLPRHDLRRVGGDPAFFVPRGTFGPGGAESLLRLVPFHESATPVLSDAPRVKVTNVGLSQEITITGHSLADFLTPGFQEFLSKAVEGFLNQGKPGKLKRASEL